MKNINTIAIAFVGVALLATGCAKKSSDQASFSGTGFDSLSTTEELAQLPQAANSSQQTSVEVLPIETAPVTQSISQTAGTLGTTAMDALSVSATGLTREQQIQTALKAAGLYQGNIDGKIGPKTKKAIEQFQANNGLKVDGKVGPQTWAVLQSYLTGQVSTEAAGVTAAE